MRDSGSAAAVALGAGAVLLLAGWLPIGFEYRPNDLGIVSVATRERYPLQQEIFWALFAGIAAGVVTWGFARLLSRAARPSPGLEMLAAASLLALLWAPPPLDALGFAFLATGAVLAARRAGRRAEPRAAPGPPLPPRAPLGAARVMAGLALALALGALLSPGLWEHAWSVAHGVPDERNTSDHFKFLAETGQHLAWADALRRGAFHGRDFFCLYGPLYDLGLVAFWRGVGRSIAAFELYWSLTRVLGWVSVLALGAALLRRPALVLLLPFLLPWVKLRLGLPLFGLLFLVLFLRRGRAAWAVLAGAAAGASLLYSQEFGAAFVLCAGFGLALRLDARGGLCFGAGLAAVVGPLFAWYAVEGALGPMLRDLSAYPAYMMAGFGKLPFPALLPELPLDVLPGRDSLSLRLGYAVPAVLVAAVLWLLPVWDFEPRRPLASLARMRKALAGDPERLALLLLALFGAIAFRSALGRSQLSRTLAVLPPAALLLAWALDRLLDMLRSAELRPLALWRGAALLAFVCYAGFPSVASPVSLVESSVRDVAALVRGGHHPRGSAQVMRVTRWVQLHTDPDEPVLFLPNDAAYYYLSRRPNPIRFAVAHQMVTDAHRAEVLETLRRRPPRYVIWDRRVLRVDGLSDEEIFGSALLEWLQTRYALETRLGQVEVLRFVGEAGA